MNTSLLIAIGLAVVVVCLFLLRKSSRKDVTSAPEVPQRPLPESVEGKKEVEGEEEPVEELAETDLQPQAPAAEPLPEDEPAAQEQEEEEQVDVAIDLSPDEQIDDITSEEKALAEFLAADDEDGGSEDLLSDILEEDKADADGPAPEALTPGEDEVQEAVPDEITEPVIEEDSGDEILAWLESDILDEQESAAGKETEADETDAVPTLTIEEYETRLRKREKEQHNALIEAINNGDDIQRDHLQIELVAITNRIALLDDSYKQELERRQVALNALDEMASTTDTTLHNSIRKSLLCEDTEPAEEFFAGIVDKKGEKAPQAAFLAARLAEARGDLYLALERYCKAVELDGNNCEYLRAAGVMARKLYRYRDARPMLEKLVDLLAKEDSNSIDLALARRELGYIYALSGNLKQAGPLYKQAMKTIAAILGPEHLEMGRSWCQIAELQEVKGQYEQAELTYSKALAIMDKALGPEHPALDQVLEKLAGLNAELEEDNKAAVLYERLCVIRERTLGSTHPKLAMALQNLAEAYRLQGQYEPSEESYRKALAIMEENHGDNHPAVAAILQELAKLCRRQKKNDEAERFQQRASKIFDQSILNREENINEDDLNL